MKKTILLTGLSVIIGLTMAQDSPKKGDIKVDTKDKKHWTKTSEIGLNLAQSSFSDNWQSGGINNIASTIFFNGSANYKKGQHSFDNKLAAAVGFVRSKQTGTNSEEYSSTRKSQDVLLLDSKYGYAFKPKWNLFGSALLQTQLLKGFDYTAGIDQDIKTQKSNFLSQGSMIEAIGLEYQPNKHFSARWSPLGLRQVFMIDQNLYTILGATELSGVGIGKNLLNEAGMHFNVKYDKDIAKNMNLKLGYISFAPYKSQMLNSWDSRIDAQITAKITKYISTNLTGIFIFDKDQSNDWQTSEVLSLGFLYKM